MVSAVERPEAEFQQRRVARERRDVLRELLRSAARMGALPWGTVRIANFDKSGTVQAPECVILDKDLPGDSDFRPVYLDSTAAPASAAATGLM